MRTPGREFDSVGRKDRGPLQVRIGYSGMYGAVGRAGLFVGMLDSNEVLFEVEDCSDSSVQKR